jgi:hypothetical protein
MAEPDEPTNYPLIMCGGAGTRLWRASREVRPSLRFNRSGHTAESQPVGGKIVETEDLPAHCAVAPVGLGWLPDTILTRSVIIRLRRRHAGESVEPFRNRSIPERHCLSKWHWRLGPLRSRRRSRDRPICRTQFRTVTLTSRKRLLPFVTWQAVVSVTHPLRRCYARDGRRRRSSS